ncbi:nuclear envelope integral membrane protein 1-like isoform X2 [Portunus trituberculatus]|uniref:nuclear envelope integral membrane protein 1-like isoform X2 n=1 Tax=Portunus trituberculatus TaxID=210409 RepID=UPI001E1D0978|nr:nuclear envelope integral membrane protein 1-like isoform X2 [Portunus trituberculatus]
MDSRRLLYLSFSIIFLSASLTQALDKIPGIDPGRGRDGMPGQHPHPREATPSPHQAEAKDYYRMQAGRELIIVADSKNPLYVFCYHGERKMLTTFFKTIELRVDIVGDNFHHYEGSNATEVKQKHSEASWFTFYPWRQRVFRLELYKESCVGIETASGYKVALRTRWVDFWRVVVLVGSVVLFFTASHLAHNTFFHYTTGISLGVVGSLLIVVYVVARMVPKKSGAVTLMVGGWGLTVYLLQYLWQNFVSIVKEHQAVAVGYVVVAGLVSFAVVYRYGPLTDQRSINLVQWSMQLVALLGIFFSSQYREATLGLVLVMVTYHCVPDKWKAKAQTYWRRRFPPKVRPLTEEEYIQQGNYETRRALEELRTFCHSPKCDAWKTISRLQSPQRFAEFVEGGSHLDDEAILAYESNHLTPLRDEDLLTTDDEDEVEEEQRGPT